MKRLTVISVHILLLCVLGYQSKEACSRKGELESTDVNDDALSIPRCPVSVNLLKVGMMIPRQNTYQLESQALPEWMNATLVQEGRRFAFNNFGLLSFSSYIRAIILAGSQDLASWLPSFDKSMLANNVAKASLTSAFETLGAVSAEGEAGANAEDLKRMLDYITIDERTKDPKKYAKVSLDEVMWEAMEYDLKMSPFSKDFQNFPHDFQRMRKWQLPVNQFSLALGHYTMFGLPFSMKNITMLLNGSREEKEGWLHLWAVLGSIMGIEDGFNIALLQNLDEVAAYYKEIINAYVVPSFHHLTRQQKVLIEAVLKELICDNLITHCFWNLPGLSLVPHVARMLFQSRGLRSSQGNPVDIYKGHYTMFGLPFSMKNITMLLNGSREEKEGWLHLWAVLGSIMGIEDGFNIALLQNLDEVAAYYKEIINAYVVPSFHHLTRQQKVLIEAVLKASSAMMPLDGLSLTPRLNMVIFLEEFFEIEAHKTRSLLDEEQNYSLKLWQELKLYMHDISFLDKNPYLLSSFNEEVRVKVVTVE